MTYLIQNTRPFSLTIAGNDQTDRLVQFDVADESYYRNGLVVTTGSILLSTLWDEDPYTNYSSGEFRRGDLVVFEVQYPDGSIETHPRGYLRVLAASYEPETEQTVIEVGCTIALHNLLDDPSPFLDLAPTTLDPVAETFEGLNASLAAAGMYIYQDNTGTVVRKKVLDDGNSFLSIRGETALSVSPLQSAQPVPDAINLSYQQPANFDGDDPKPEDVNQTNSYYFIAYPGLTYFRKPPEGGEIEDEINEGDIDEGTQDIPDTTACGTPPENNEAVDGTPYICSDQYETEQNTIYLPAERVQVDTSSYLGPAGQVSTRVSETYGPAIEANSQYFGDKYEYCRRVFQNPCSPNGQCPYYGLTEVDMMTLLNRTVTTYFYGEANELVKTVQDSYTTELSAASTNDYRAGGTDPTTGAFNFFDNDFAANHMKLFRVRRIVTENNVPDDKNINRQNVTTFSSVTSREKGILTWVGTGAARYQRLAKIDALDGIQTLVVNRTTTTAAFDNAPERITAAAEETEERTTKITVQSNDGAPSFGGEYIVDDSVPAPLLYGSEQECETKAQQYGKLLSALIVGDARGLSISESMRKDITNGWYPSRKFQYFDDKHDKLMAMRMDATSWAVDNNGSAFTTSGFWMTDLSGTVSIPGNIVGDSKPNMDGGAPSAPENGPGDGSDPAPGDPSVINPLPIGNNYMLDINVELSIGVVVSFHGNDGIVPVPDRDNIYEVPRTLAVAVRGMIAAPGALISAGPNGGLPADYNGSLVVDGTEVVDGDLFAPVDTSTASAQAAASGSSTGGQAGSGY